jgi:hypothetical protein
MGAMGIGIEDAGQVLAQMLADGKFGTSGGNGTLSRPALGVKSALESNRSYRSVTVECCGDSTGTDTTEWFGLTWSSIASKYPDWNLVWQFWNPAIEDFNAPIYLQTGTSGERYCEYAGTGVQRYVNTTPATNTDDLDVRVRCWRNWRSGVGTGTQTLVSRWDSGPTNGASLKSWYLWMDGTGKPNYDWSADGVTQTASVSARDGSNASVSVPFADNEIGWVRVTHDVDNGASGNTVTFYTSTDGTTWTMLGVPQVTAGVTSLGPSTTDYRLACSWGNTVAQNFLTGRIYWAEVRLGSLLSAKASVVPPLPDDWEQVSTSSSLTWGGSPSILLINASMSGKNIAWFSDVNRAKKIWAPKGQRLIFLSTNHNEGNVTGDQWYARLTTWLAQIRNYQPYAPIVMMTQNPTAAPLYYGQIQMRAERGQSIMTFAANNVGTYGCDIYPAFPMDLTGLVEPADGLHPTQGWDGGSGVWARAVIDQLGL